jgi:hypothetical protein
MAWTQIRTLVPDRWLEESVLEFYICQKFEGKLQMVYIPMDVISMIRGEREGPAEARELFQSMREMQGTPRNERQAAFVMNTRQLHWFVVVFDWEMQTSWVFNQKVLSTAEYDVEAPYWGEWRGPELWKRVAVLLRWATREEMERAPAPASRGLRWPGVG